jgi:hypothetical protein
LARHLAPQPRQLQIHLPKILISNKQCHALAFDGFSFAGLDPIAHDLLPLTKRAAVGIVPPGANLPKAEAPVMEVRQKLSILNPSRDPCKSGRAVKVMQFSPQ